MTKGALLPAMAGRADPDVIKCNDHPANRNLLLPKGGISQKLKSFEDRKLNALFDAIAAEPDSARRLPLTAQVQRCLVEQAYFIPMFEEPQVYAGAPWLLGVDFEAVGRPSLHAAWIAPH